MSSKNIVLRKTFPRVIKTEDKRRGLVRYVVDTRKNGKGERLFFEREKDAVARAKELAQELPVDRGLGIALSSELRAMAHKCASQLAGFSKTIEDATRFYIDHLTDLQRKQESSTVERLAREWFEEKKAGKQRPLRKDTLESIKDTSKTLRKQFGTKKILEITTEELIAYFDSLNAGHQRRHNVKSLFSQFFNWCKSRRYIRENPLQFYKIAIPRKEPTTLTITQCKTLVGLILDKHKHLGIYTVLCLFAGIRPSECARLQIEDINISERVVSIKRTRAKTHQGRDVKIEDNLVKWLDYFIVEKKSGPIVNTTNLRTKLEELRADLGFKVLGRNPYAPKWPEDVLRHTYASYWIALYQDRPKLAEYMGNSPHIIGQRYKRVVPKSEAIEFWGIVPRT
jgi:integrase